MPAIAWKALIVTTNENTGIVIPAFIAILAQVFQPFHLLGVMNFSTGLHLFIIPAILHYPGFGYQENTSLENYRKTSLAKQYIY